ncbi:VacJ-like lipoprotein [Oleispira antarctica RB-8]|uniref:VacJ-like lipoprotein n=1 Tax=Oleispira antarctica RB-8 TaxID=698738 RepID=R4YM59_OLEAN|nr:VacJ-like lipoprotein [Oleispira antarctica RB-8]
MVKVQYGLFLISLLILPKLGMSDESVDPWQGFNRSVFEFNETLDMYVAKPVAQGYQAVTPQFVDTGVSNFFSNLEDVLIVLNDVFQLKPVQALSDTGRFLINSTIGLFGFFDVASHIGLMKHDEDLGQTLGYWGVGAGPYIMLPVLGPSNVRDTFGLAGDSLSGFGYTEVTDTLAQQSGLWLLRNIDVRADLIASEGLITGDRYTFFRSFYMQRRDYLVRDGVVEDEFGDDFDEDFEQYDEEVDEDLY